MLNKHFSDSTGTGAKDEGGRWIFNSLSSPPNLFCLANTTSNVHAEIWVNCRLLSIIRKMKIHQCHVLELPIGMNVKDHRRFSALLKQQREKLEKCRLERGFKLQPLRCQCSALDTNFSGLSRCYLCRVKKLRWSSFTLSNMFCTFVLLSYSRHIISHFILRDDP